LDYAVWERKIEGGKKRTYHLIVLVTKLLAHELAHPVITRVSVL
jgi:hypothetical protein